MHVLLNDHDLTERIFAHIAARTTDLGTGLWREPVENYRSAERFASELGVLRSTPTPFCPSAYLPQSGSFVAREAAGVPIVAARGEDGVVRAFRNVCRHRGLPVAQGAGCAKAFVCGYHGWTYGLDGALRHVPHEVGFPGLDRADSGLSRVDAIEKNGLVFITQDATTLDAKLDDLPPLIRPDQAVLASQVRETPANWKIMLEGFIEGYHIRATHPQSFLPYGFDNLNVIEFFDRHCRVTFPFRRIDKLKDVPANERRVSGLVTFVYHLFPNVLLTVLSNHTNLVVLEPLAPDRTNVVTYALTNAAGADALDAAKRDAAFVAGAGVAEDRAVVCAIQNGLTSGAAAEFVFGRCESALVHFHRNLDAALARSA